MADVKTNRIKGVTPDGAKIREFRKRKGLSQKSLVYKANVTSRTLQRAEKGERVMPEVLNTIAHALDVKPLDIMVEATEGLTRTADDPRHGVVRLKRVESARQVNKMIMQEDIDFDFDVDADESTA